MQLNTLTLEISRLRNDGLDITSSQVVPNVDGVSLVQLVTDFEAARGWDVAGEYAGIVPDHYQFGDLLAHFLGDGPGSSDDRSHLLGCECGEVGCWPLEAIVQAADATVTWSSFSQPFRPLRDYHGFGPFTFARQSYEAAVCEAAAQLG